MHSEGSQAWEEQDGVSFGLVVASLVPVDCSVPGIHAASATQVDLDQSAACTTVQCRYVSSAAAALQHDLHVKMESFPNC